MHHGKERGNSQIPAGTSYHPPVKGTAVVLTLLKKNPKLPSVLMHRVGHTGLRASTLLGHHWPACFERILAVTRGCWLASQAIAETLLLPG